jgi:hypothetical protein
MVTAGPLSSSALFPHQEEALRLPQVPLFWDSFGCDRVKLCAPPMQNMRLPDSFWATVRWTLIDDAGGDIARNIAAYYRETLGD